MGFSSIILETCFISIFSNGVTKYSAVRWSSQNILQLKSDTSALSTCRNLKDTNRGEEEKRSWRGKGKRGEMWEDNEKQKKWTEHWRKRECRVKTLGIYSSHLGKGQSGVSNWIHISGRAMGWYWSTRSPPANAANQHTWNAGDSVKINIFDLLSMMKGLHSRSNIFYKNSW